MIFRAGFFLCLFAISVAADQAAGQTARKLREALPVDVASVWRAHNFRSPINVSRDGVWVAHTILASDTVTRDTRRYTATGVPLAEGDRRREATVTNTRTGEVVLLGTATGSSWAPVWSPDSQKAAFYSDEGGEAGIWIWDVKTRQARRVHGVIARPLFGFEIPRWSADSKRLLVKILPEGQTIAQANELGRRRRKQKEPIDPDAPTVTVQRVTPDQPKNLSTAEPPEEDPRVQKKPTHDTSQFVVDLAIIDIESGSVRRPVKDAAVRYYAFSPDGLHIAYSVFKGGEPNTQQSNFDLLTLAVETGITQKLASNIRLAYGIEWSYSPDGRYLAYIPCGQLARLVVSKGLSDERLVLLSTKDGKATSIRGEHAPIFDPGDGEYAPIWEKTGRHLYQVGDGAVWRIDRDSGAIRKLAEVPGWNIRYLVARTGNHTLWQTDDGNAVWAFAREKDGISSAIVRVDTTTGDSKVVLAEYANYSATFNVDAADATGEIVFVSSDLQHLAGLRIFDTRSGLARYGPALNSGLDRYEPGTSEVIHWQSPEGEPLSGALLLPPGKRAQPLPLVVWVYGGSHGSRAVNQFGLVSPSPVFNMHILATRGYAVLFPDIPITQPGQTIQALMSAVMPGVDEAIRQGIADPNRLAIMGQSYGAHNVLSILTRTPRFRAAIITAAVTHPDLFAGYLHSTGYYEKGQGNMGGSIWEFPDRYRENSPLFRFDRIETPLLIGQGEKDGDLVASEAIFLALERLEKLVEYRVYGGEGHVITKPANVVDFWNRRLEFLAEHLELGLDENGRVVPK